MGSKSKRTPEEIKEQDRKDREEYNKTHEIMNIQGGSNNSYRVPGGGQVETYTTKRGGRRAFLGDDGNTYYLNEGNGRWESNTRTSDYYNLGSIAPSGGGGGGGGGQAAPPQPTYTGQGDVVSPGVTTPDVVGGYQAMQDWTPISNQIGGGGIQGMNPLADPMNWLHQLQPQPTYSPGLYQGQGIGLLQQNYNNGLLGGS